MGTAIRVILLWWWAWPFWLAWQAFGLYVNCVLEPRRFREFCARHDAERDAALYGRTLCPECRPFGDPGFIEPWGCPRCGRVAPLAG